MCLLRINKGQKFAYLSLRGGLLDNKDNIIFSIVDFKVYSALIIALWDEAKNLHHLQKRTDNKMPVDYVDCLDVERDDKFYRIVLSQTRRPYSAVNLPEFCKKILRKDKMICKFETMKQSKMMHEYYKDCVVRLK